MNWMLGKQARRTGGLEGLGRQWPKKGQWEWESGRTSNIKTKHSKASQGASWAASRKQQQLQRWWSILLSKPHPAQVCALQAMTWIWRRYLDVSWLDHLTSISGKKQRRARSAWRQPSEDVAVPNEDKHAASCGYYVFLDVTSSVWAKMARGQ